MKQLLQLFPIIASSWVGYILTFILAVGLTAWALIRHYDKVELVGSKLARWVSWFSKRAERAAVGLEIQSRCDTLSKLVNSEVPGAIPYGLKVEWLRETTPEAFITQGQVVVRMEHHRNQARNLVLAIITYLPKALLPQSRSYLHPTTVDALDFTIARRVLDQFDVSALTYFIHDILEPAFERDKEMRSACGAMEALDDFGFLVHVLIREFVMLGVKLFPRVPSSEVLEETKQFVKFLETIARRERGTNVPLDFRGKFIRVGLVMVARPAISGRHGAAAYVRRVVTLIKQGTKNIYVNGWGHNLPLVGKIADDLSSIRGLTRERDTVYALKDGDRTWESRTVLFRNNVAPGSPETKELEDRLHTAFLSSLIHDILALEEKTGLEDQGTIHGVIVSNPHYDPGVYPPPAKILDELRGLGILVPRDVDGRTTTVVAHDNAYVRAALKLGASGGES